jgi:hypothetical protein
VVHPVGPVMFVIEEPAGRGVHGGGQRHRSQVLKDVLDEFGGGLGVGELADGRHYLSGAGRERQRCEAQGVGRSASGDRPSPAGDHQ